MSGKTKAKVCLHREKGRAGVTGAQLMRGIGYTAHPGLRGFSRVTVRARWPIKGDPRPRVWPGPQQVLHSDERRQPGMCGKRTDEARIKADCSQGQCLTDGIAVFVHLQPAKRALTRSEGWHAPSIDLPNLRQKLKTLAISNLNSMGVIIRSKLWGGRETMDCSSTLQPSWLCGSRAVRQAKTVQSGANRQPLPYSDSCCNIARSTFSGASFQASSRRLSFYCGCIAIVRLSKQ
ncbi:hypothetical protein N656DRAFT_605517 [Canariomyces notabilis]|uniref:Uncharacterized protein n=1 Tax=Canariomyces notabilis TaxID=2074819 RepID=A0AAN6TGB0_9PEZI|nr:hypothetical protein N656DRAFT_605517 [Canariomyces arenarius]